MKKKTKIATAIAAVVVLGLAGYSVNSQYCFYAPDVGQLGGPIEGLTPGQLRKFYDAKKVFLQEFTPEEGLGPLFNGRSCFECHGQPGAVGGEGRDVVSTGVVRVGARKPGGKRAHLPVQDIIATTTTEDVHLMVAEGGPALERKSITSEFPNKYDEHCQIEIAMIPKGAEFVSLRHSPPLFGEGLVDAIPDRDILNNAFVQTSFDEKMAGRAIARVDPVSQTGRVARFGWKNQNSTLQVFTSEALNVEMGITTPIHPSPKSAKGASEFPHCIIPFLPKEPNDVGHLINKLTYFQALLAPPKRGMITPQALKGEKVFEKARCAVCHVPEMRTASKVYLADPDSPAPRLTYIEVAALENKPVRAFSDFLVHNMGPGLADGLPQAGAKGGEWRTTPLWGLRNKKFLLHDGRTTSIPEAILAHGGQASSAKELYIKLSPEEKEDLLAFLKSL